MVAGAVLGGLAVIAGAFGAHMLEGRIDEASLQTWDLASRYQMYHALSLLMVGTLKRQAAMNIAGWLFVVGVVLFSGTLYVLAATGFTWLGAITPIGGVALIGGWAALAVGAVRAD
jgi:uncharacterized membrane protein YgdD (TMEM256/DUF423 family)